LTLTTIEEILMEDFHLHEDLGVLGGNLGARGLQMIGRRMIGLGDLYSLEKLAKPRHGKDRGVLEAREVRVVVSTFQRLERVGGSRPAGAGMMMTEGHHGMVEMMMTEVHGVVLALTMTMMHRELHILLIVNHH
jgi:hypothetical protein